MEPSDILIYVVSPMLTAIIGGVGYCVKRYLKRQDELIAERNERMDKIEDDLEKLKRDVADMQSIIIECEHPNCPSRTLLANWMAKRNSERTHS